MENSTATGIIKSNYINCIKKLNDIVENIRKAYRTLKKHERMLTEIPKDDILNPSSK
mgnify:CR=1 FL=1